MRKTTWTLLMSLLLATFTGIALAGAVGERDTMQLRAERIKASREARKNAPARPQASTNPAKVPIYGGTDGNKPLYGIHFENYFFYSYGVLCEFLGPAQIDTKANHTKVADVNIGSNAGCYFNGKYLAVSGIDTNKVTYQVYDAETWTPVGMSLSYKVYENGDDDFVLPTDLTYDPTTNRIYGVFVNKAMLYASTSKVKLGYIDVNTLDMIKPVVELPKLTATLSSDKNGQLYGVAYDGKIYKINKETGAMTDPIQPSYPANAAPNSTAFNWGGVLMSSEIDWDTNNMYYSTMEWPEGDDSWGAQPYILKVGLADGQTTVVANYSYNDTGAETETQDIFTGLYFKQAVQATAGQPNEVIGLRARAKDVEQKALLSFTMPDKSTDGKVLEAGTSWKAFVNDVEVGTGTAEPGAQVINAEVALPAFGNNMILVKAVSKDGKLSAGNTTSVFVGCDTPKMNRPDVQANGSSVALFWDEATSANNGNMKNVRYKVERLPDNKVITEATTETAVEDTFAASDAAALYTYRVTPLADGNAEGEVLTGAPVETLQVFAGSYLPLPWTDAFDDNMKYGYYKTIDANNDGNTWVYNQQYKSASYASNGNDANDYLLIGPFDMTQGCVYNFGCDIQAHSGVEYAALYVGTDPASVAEYKELTGRTAVNTNQDGVKHLGGEYTADATGRYYFAVKACSDASSSVLYVDNVKVTGVTAEMPKAPEFTATPSLKGAKLTIKCPTENIDGTKANVTAVNVYRDGVLIGTVTEGVSDGATVTFTDDKAMDGVEGSNTQVNYAVSAVNAAGEGLKATQQALVGLDYPGTPRNFRVWEDLQTPGLIHIKWDAPETGYSGGFFDPDHLTYRYDWSSMSHGVADEVEVSGNEATFKIYDGVSDPDQVSVSVWAVNSLGTMKYSAWITSSTIIGKAVELPVIESFANGRTEHIWAGLSDNGGSWDSWAWSTSSTYDYKSQDADDWLYIFGTDLEQGSYRVCTPRITLKGAENPTMIAYVYYTDAIDSYTVQIRKEDAESFEDYYSIPVTTDQVGKWNQIKLDLKSLRDLKYLQLAFVPKSKASSDMYAAFDNVSILDLHEHDLMAVNITASSELNVSDENKVRLTLRNSSDNKVLGSDYKVALSKNGNVIGNIDGVDIEPFSNVTLEYIDQLLSGDGAEATYTAEIVYEADQDAANNKFASVKTSILANDYPAPRNLTGNAENGVTLSWEAPDLSNRPNASTLDDFEAYNDFALDNFGAWRTKDVDGQNTITTGMSFWGTTIVFDYPSNGKPSAWVVMNPGEAGIMSSAWYSRNDGVRFLAAYRPADGSKANDWLMSPELDGSAQTISFYARGGNYGMTEPLSVYYTTKNSNDVADYVKIGETLSIPYANDWQEYTVDLPEGALHFALVYEGGGDNNYAVLVDDITYIAAGSKPLELELLSYYVYRDNILLDEVGADVLTYNDASAEEGKSYVYNVSAYWQRGESVLSNAATVTASGVNVVADDFSAVKVGSQGLNIVVRGAGNAPIHVYNTAGLHIASRVADGDAVIAVGSAGIYIVKVGNRSFKLMVR